MIITFLTDFGTSDYYVGAMKGAALSADPAAVLVDISHDVPPQDLLAGAFNLSAAYSAFPAETVHVAVVDPGVGTARRAIAVRAGEHYFVGPDNGLFTFVYACEKNLHVYELTNGEYFRQPVSNTFHGRDIFAPVAGALSRGVALADLGTQIFDPVVLIVAPPEGDELGVVTGSVIHIDRFGNCVTNIRRAQVGDFEVGMVLDIGEHSASGLETSYGDVESHEVPFMIWGSAGYLEISLRERSAASLLRINRGDAVKVRPAIVDAL